MTSELLAVFCASTIALNIFVALLILSSGLESKKPHYIALIALCIFTSIYQYTTWQYHLSSTVAEAVFWLKFQSSAAVLASAANATAFVCWVRHRYARQISQGVFVFSAVIAFVNLFSEFTLRFKSVEGLRLVTLFNGEQIHLLQGGQSSIGSILHGIYLLFILAILLIVASSFYRVHKALASAFIVTLVLFIFSAYIGMSIDAGKMNSFYVAGVPYTLLSIIACFIIAGSLELQTKRLKIAVQKRQQLELAMSKLAKDISSLDGESFYQSMLMSIYELFKFDIAFIGLQQQPGKIHTLAVVKKGQVAEPFSYDLAQTPCEQVMANNTCVYEYGVDQEFPQDLLLQQMRVTGYIGLPLLGGKDKLLGVLAVLHTDRLEVSPDMLETLTIFADRAGAEIKRNLAEKKLRTAAYVDYITRLPNRCRFFEELHSQNKRNLARNENSVLMVLDLDRFTEVNKLYGYDAGEYVLRELGTRFSHYAGSDIFIARNGGDEFSILLRNATQQPLSVIEVHWQAIKAIINTPIHYGERTIKLNSSMGAVIFPEQTQAKFDIVRSAEDALHCAKLLGHGQHSLFDPSRLAQRELSRELEAKLASALKLDDGQLYIVYQPKTDGKGTLLGGEALMRWQHPTEGFISPAEFIAVAEKSTLINQVGDFLLAKVCQQINAWQQNSAEQVVKISVNISTVHFAEDNFLSNLMSILAKYDILPQQLEIELTESGLLHNITNAVEKIRQLQQVGFTIALDDFGTGYSSLSYLHQLPLDVLKIDKAFVDNIFDDRAFELIRSIIAIGHNMKLNIVAEGTETQEQVDALLALGCQQFQGYYFSKPLPADEFATWAFEPNEVSEEPPR